MLTASWHFRGEIVIIDLGIRFQVQFRRVWVLFESFQVIVEHSDAKKHWLKPSVDFLRRHK